MLRSILIHFEIQKWWKHWNNKLCVEASHLWPVHLRGIDYAMFDKLGAGRCNWVAAPILSLDNAGIRWLSCCTTRPLFWRSGSRLLHVCCGYFGAFLNPFGSRDELAIVWEWAGSLSSQPRDLRLAFGYNQSLNLAPRFKLPFFRSYLERVGAMPANAGNIRAALARWAGLQESQHESSELIWLARLDKHPICRKVGG